jgi:ubiquinone/menaquinone biosynthesis C-methylase UbiE
MTAQHRDEDTAAVTMSLHDQFFAPIDMQMLEWLQLAPGAHVLDVGCGPGVMAARFAEATGPNGAVVAFDINPTVLANARQYVQSTPVAERVTFQEGDLLKAPYEQATFDLTWCSFAIHHMPDPVAAAREMQRVTKPGGRVVLRETGVPLRMLPLDIGIGAPGLNDRLRVASNRWFVTHRYAPPVEQPYPWGWTQALRDAGLRDVTARTFLLEALPPFTAMQQAYLFSWLQSMLADPERRACLEPEDQGVLEQLVDPDSPHYALQRPDLHVLCGLSLYVGFV